MPCAPLATRCLSRRDGELAADTHRAMGGGSCCNGGVFLHLHASDEPGGLVQGFSSGAYWSTLAFTSEAPWRPSTAISSSDKRRRLVSIAEAKAAGATSVEVILYDRAGNSASKRVALK